MLKKALSLRASRATTGNITQKANGPPVCHSGRSICQLQAAYIIGNGCNRNVNFLQAQLPGDEQSLNLRGAFADFTEFGISQETLGGEIYNVAVTTVNLHAEIANFAGDFRGVELSL